MNSIEVYQVNMKNRIKIQHYVPRLYLRNFSAKSGKCFFIYSFDKTTTSKFLVNIKRIGCERYFYEIPGDSDQLIEKTLGRIESGFNTAYQKLIKAEDSTCLTNEDKISFAYFIATQWIRTKEQRETIKDLIDQLTKQLLKDELSKELENQVEKANTEQFIRLVHRDVLKGIPLYSDIILNKKWILFINKTDTPYWTSDHPINLYNPISFGPFGNLGLLSKGIQIYFPLTIKLSLCLCDPDYSFPDKYEISNIQNIIFQNHLQVKWSTRYILSLNEDFSLAETIIRENPELKEINRRRISLS